MFFLYFYLYFDHLGTSRWRDQIWLGGHVHWLTSTWAPSCVHVFIRPVAIVMTRCPSISSGT